MESATRFVHGADIVAVMVVVSHQVTVNHAWADVSIGLFWWASCGAVLVTSLDAAAWWIVGRGAVTSNLVDSPVDAATVVAGRIGATAPQPLRHAA